MLKHVSHYFDAYKAWVRQHAEVLYLVETSLSSITWLLPDRFEGNELLLEGIHTASNLLSVFHESIINELDKAGPRGSQELTLAISALQQVEVLIELYAIFSKRVSNRYDALFVVESLKALVRLAIYRISHQRLLLQGGLASFDTTAYSQSPDALLKAKRTLSAFDNFRKRHLLRSDCILTDQNHKGGHDPGTEYWWSTYPSMSGSNQSNFIQMFEQRMKQTDETSSKLLITGEILHILRPVVYTACLRMWGVKSWKPWMLSLILELSSAQATYVAQRCSNKVVQQIEGNSILVRSTLSILYAKQGMMWSPQELDELTKRKLLLVFYLIRDPVFGRVTLPIMQKWVQTVGRVPMVSWLSERFTDFIQGIQKYYTYTSGA